MKNYYIKFIILILSLFILNNTFAQNEKEGPPLSTESLMGEDFVVNPALYDAYIQRTLQIKYDNNPHLSKIYVSSQNGEVILDGNENNMSQMEYATDIATTTLPIRSVEVQVQDQ